MGAMLKPPGAACFAGRGPPGGHGQIRLPLARGGGTSARTPLASLVRGGTSARTPPAPLSGGREIYLNRWLKGEPVGLEEIGPGRWLLYFGRLPLGVINKRLPKIQRPV